jgi:hypothetical protein
MPILVEQRGDRFVEIETSTGKIVDRIEIRDGFMHYMASDGQVLESVVIGRKHSFVCNACGLHCEAANLTGQTPGCVREYNAPNWTEVE